MSTSSYIFNSVHQPDASPDNPVNTHHTHLLSLIAAHPSFKTKVNSFLALFPHGLTAEPLIKMGTLIHALLLPDFPRPIQRKMAVELFNSLQLGHQQETSTVTYTTLSEFLLKICTSLVENMDVRSALGILSLIESRIVDYCVIDVEDKEFNRKIPMNIKLQVFDSENVIGEVGLPEKQHRRAGEYIYYEEKVQMEEDIKVKPTQILIKKLKEKVEDVIPLGYVFEEFSNDFINANFQAKNSYRLKGNKCVQVGGKVDFWVSINSNASNALRDCIVNQEIYENCPILTIAHLPESVNPAEHKSFNIYRINQTFTHKNYYQKLKEVTEAKENPSSKYFNILSEFHQRDEFNIDELALTKEKLIIRRKEHLLGIEGKEAIKKEEKDYELESRTLADKISENKRMFTDNKRMEENIRELSKSLRMFLEEDRNINVVMDRMLSAHHSLPKDSSNPFEEDIINLAKKQPLQILIIGRAKSGKSTLAKLLAKEYSLVYISIESMIDKVIERSNFFKENPPEADEDGNVKDGLLKIEECILADLEEGRQVEEEDILDLINNELRKEFTQSRGYVLDLPFEYSSFWYSSIVSNKVYVPKIGCRFFNRVIQIEQTEDEWKYFLERLMIKTEDLTVNSAYDRYIRAKPKPPPEEGEEEEEAGGDDAEKPPPLIQSNMLLVKWDNSSLPLIEHLTLHIHPLHYIKVRNSYQSPVQCLDSLSTSLYRIPLPKKIEGAEKQLLTVGLDEQKVVRKWSPWGLTDCVELCREKLMMGKFQFAAEYAGRVFVFENENNQNLFINNPRQYLRKLPELPKKTNIAIAGPRKSGKKTIAKILSQIYGLKIIDFEQILKNVLLRQKQLENHVPSNPDRTSKHVHLSEPEFKDFNKGSLLNAKDILPIILFELGIPLQKKPPGWGIEKNEEEGEEAVEEKKPPPKKPAKKKDAKQEDERPKTPPLEDLGLKEIIPTINHKGKLDEIKGFILVGFPHNEEQLNALKAFNIPIDKFILLSDNSEENPYKNLEKRLKDAEIQQIANFMTNIAPVKQALGEDNCKEITNLDQAPEDIVNKIRQFIDPFYPKCDDDAINRVCADKQEEGDPIPMGFCGDYCPVTLADGWLIKGKEEFETGFQGKRFKFVGENQLNTFKENPLKYLKKDNLQIQPRIMFMGMRGVGLKTQLQKLNQKYKIPIASFKDTLLQLLENEKSKRKSERYYNKGFKIPEFDEEGKQVEDPELNEESPEFDRAALEVEMTKKMFNGINEIFINGNYYDVQEDAVQTPFVDLLANARKLPEVVFMLRCDEKKWLERNLDKRAIEEELEGIKEKRREEKAKEKAEAKQRAEEAGQQYQQPEQVPEDEDPEIPKLEEMIAQKEEALKAQRQNDAAKLEQLTETFKSWNVEVIEVKCERDIRHVNDRINYSLKPVLEDRMNKWEQNNMLPIERHRVKDFINNYIAIESRFGELNPFTLMKPVYSYPLIYNDRVYYLNDEEERERVMRNPYSLNQECLAAPSDVKIYPSISIIGLPKTGKTTLAENISKRLGLVHIQIQSMIEEFFNEEHQDEGVIKILKQLKKGNTLSDTMLVDLLEKRLSMSDCQKKGYIMDGFPYNLDQCYLLNRKNLLPNNIFCLKLTEHEIKRRVLSSNKNKNKADYDYDMEVVHSRIESNRENLVEVQVYFSTKFNNLVSLDGKVSKWGIYEVAKKEIEVKVKARKDFVRSLITHSATPASHIGLHFNCILNNLSEFDNFCPISFKIRREYVKLCPKHHRNLVIHNKKIYTLAGEKQLKDFIMNPENYKSKGNSFHPPQQIAEDVIHSIMEKAENKAYCMVDLTRKKLTKGNSKFTLRYKNKFYMLGSANNMKMFVKNPVMFEMVKLQDKLPVEFEKKNDLKKIAKKNDCTAFLEHHLSNILMKSLAQLGYRRPKYPTLGSKESALKFLAIILKASNPNKDEQYRQKYNEKLQRFIRESNYSQDIREELGKREKGSWQSYEQENLLKVCEEYNEFLKVLNSSDKNKYFSEFIR